MVTDPVCGMEIDPNEAAGTSEYQGQTYYFCAPGCKKQFDKNPQQYVNQQSDQPHPQH
jgi:YHS domain-containing protein